MPTNNFTRVMVWDPTNNSYKRIDVNGYNIFCAGYIDRDTKGDVYEYMLAKIATAGQNGQFRTPRHIIAMMVELVAAQA